MAKIEDQVKRQSQCILVVPCYNEQRRLRTDEFLAFLDAHPGFHLLFVNDGSTDETLKVLQQIQAMAMPQVDLLALEANCGKAEAVRRGLLKALGKTPEFVGYWDADLATPLAEALPIVQLLEQRTEIDLVMGARVRLLGRHISRRPVRHYMGRVFATLTSIALRLPVYDTQCGAKVFRVTPRLLNVLEHPFSSRWIFDVELLGRFLQAVDADRLPAGNYRVLEYPLMTWHDVAGSKLRGVDAIRALWDLAKIAWKRRFGPHTLPKSTNSLEQAPQR